MVVVSVALCFLIAVVLAWLVLFPGAREATGECATRFGMRVGCVGRYWLQSLHWRYTLLKKGGVSVAASSWERVNRKRCLLGVAALVLSLPTMVALFASGAAVQAFQIGARSVNTQIADLLEGEHLVRPPPVPPAEFAREELAQERPMLGSADRNWQLLDPEFSRRLLVVFKIMKEQHGYEMVILEGFRTPERQTLLASLGPHVTNAAAFQSYHQFGLAADSAFLRDGRLVISERDPWAMRGYRLYGETAEAVGLHWGGRWRLRDFGHVELRQRK